MELHDGAGFVAEVLPWYGWRCDAPASAFDMAVRWDSDAGRWREDNGINSDICMRHARTTIGCYHLCDAHAPLTPEFTERWVREGRPAHHPMEF